MDSKISKIVPDDEINVKFSSHCIEEEAEKESAPCAFLNNLVVIQDAGKYTGCIGIVRNKLRSNSLYSVCITFAHDSDSANCNPNSILSLLTESQIKVLENQTITTFEVIEKNIRVLNITVGGMSVSNQNVDETQYLDEINTFASAEESLDSPNHIYFLLESGKYKGCIATLYSVNKRHDRYDVQIVAKSSQGEIEKYKTSVNFLSAKIFLNSILTMEAMISRNTKILCESSASGDNNLEVVTSNIIGTQHDSRNYVLITDGSYNGCIGEIVDEESKTRQSDWINVKIYEKSSDGSQIFHETYINKETSQANKLIDQNLDVGLIAEQNAIVLGDPSVRLSLNQLAIDHYFSTKISVAGIKSHENSMALYPIQLKDSESLSEEINTRLVSISSGFYKDCVGKIFSSSFSKLKSNTGRISILIPRLLPSGDSIIHKTSIRGDVAASQILLNQNLDDSLIAERNAVVLGGNSAAATATLPAIKMAPIVRSSSIIINHIEHHKDNSSNDENTNIQLNSGKYRGCIARVKNVNMGPRNHLYVELHILEALPNNGIDIHRTSISGDIRDKMVDVLDEPNLRDREISERNAVIISGDFEAIDLLRPLSVTSKSYGFLCTKINLKIGTTTLLEKRKADQLNDRYKPSVINHLHMNDSEEDQSHSGSHLHQTIADQNLTDTSEIGMIIAGKFEGLLAVLPRKISCDYSGRFRVKYPNSVNSLGLPKENKLKAHQFILLSSFGIRLTTDNICAYNDIWSKLHGSDSDKVEKNFFDSLITLQKSCIQLTSDALSYPFDEQTDNYAFILVGDYANKIGVVSSIELSNNICLLNVLGCSEMAILAISIANVGAYLSDSMTQHAALLWNNFLETKDPKSIPNIYQSFSDMKNRKPPLAAVESQQIITESCDVKNRDRALTANKVPVSELRVCSDSETLSIGDAVRITHGLFIGKVGEVMSLMKSSGAYSIRIKYANKNQASQYTKLVRSSLKRIPSNSAIYESDNHSFSPEILSKNILRNPNISTRLKSAINVADHCTNLSNPTIDHKRCSDLYMKIIRINVGMHLGYLAKITSWTPSRRGHSCKILCKWSPSLTVSEATQTYQRKVIKLTSGKSFVVLDESSEEYRFAIKFLNQLGSLNGEKSNVRGNLNDTCRREGQRKKDAQVFAEGEESRNNLYWVTSHNLVCLWYGRSHENSLCQDDVNVLPITMDLSSDFNGATIPVKRMHLKPLDDQVLLNCCLDAHLKAFLTALLDFSEWDDCLRDSYFWPKFIVNLMKNPIMLKHFVVGALNRVPLKRHYEPDDLSKYLVFLLCSCHIGIIGEYQITQNESTFDCDDLLFGEICESDQSTVTDTFDEYCSTEFLDLSEQIYDLTRNDSECAEVIREHSRYGDDYQASIGNVLIFEKGVNSLSEDQNLVFNPNAISQDKIAEYLSIVQLLYDINIRAGDLILCPSTKSPLMSSFVTQYENRSVRGEMFTGDSLMEFLKSNMKSSDDLFRNLARRSVSDSDITSLTHVKPLSFKFAPHDLNLYHRDDVTCCNIMNVCMITGIIADCMDGTSENPSDPAWQVKVTVFDGINQWIAPLTACSILSFNEEVALEILHKCSYNIASAVNEIAQSLNESFPDKYQSTNSTVHGCASITPQLLFKLHSLTTKYTNNAAKIWSELVNCSSNDMDAITSLLHKCLRIQPENFVERSSTWHYKGLLDIYHLVNQNDGDFCPGEEFLRRSSSDDSHHHTANIRQDYSHSKITEFNSHYLFSRGISLIQVNRWPKSLPIAYHNIYWVKTTGAPCLCVGIEHSSSKYGSDYYLRVITIRCDVHQREMSLHSSLLEPFDGEAAAIEGYDRRSLEFVLAMIDFCNWDLDNKIDEDQRRIKWYQYPSFITRFLEHSGNWSAWRKQVERAARGRIGDKQKVYYEALIEEYLKLPDDSCDRMRTFTTCPWDDNPPFDFKEVTVGSYITDNHSSSGVSANFDVENVAQVSGDRQVEHVSSTKMEIEVTPADIHEDCLHINRTQLLTMSELQLPQLVSSHDSENFVAPPGKFTDHNLYWISRSTLPGILESRGKCVDSVSSIQPICCSTYHYVAKVTWSMIDPLTYDLLERCHDDRTHDFTAAMMEFAKWDMRRLSLLENDQTQSLIPISERNHSKAKMDSSDDEEQDPVDVLSRIDPETNSYVWPLFIRSMIIQPKEWASWRKRVERQNLHGISRKDAYRSALIKEYSEILEFDHYVV